MKKVLFALVVLFVIVSFGGCFASLPPQKTATKEETTLEYIESYDGQTKDQIFSKCLVTIGTIFNSAKSVIEVSDPNGGTIIGIGRSTNIPTTCDMGGGIVRPMEDISVDILFKFVITIKDGKARYQFYPELDGYNPKIQTWSCFWEAMNRNCSSIVNEFSRQIRSSDF